MIKIGCVLACVILTGLIYGHANSTLIKAEQLGSIFEYPVAKLAVSNITKEEKAQYGAGIVAACKIESTDGTFARMTVLVTEKGMVFSPRLKTIIANSEKAAQKEPNLKRVMLREIPFGKKAYGYVGLGGFGPGGSDAILVATIPDKGYEIIMKLSIPGDPPLAITPETEAYHRIIVGERGLLVQRLIKCMELTVGIVSEFPASESVSGGASIF